MSERTALAHGVDDVPHLVGLSAAALALVPPGLAGVVRARGGLRAASAVVLAVGAAAAVPAAFGLHHVTRGRLALRDRMLDAVDWRGDEDVADLGAGGGLLGIGAATRTSGTVHCLAPPTAEDPSGGCGERLERNARRAGVADRVVVHREDVRATSLPARSVDVVVSALHLHTIADAAGRRAALGEAVRILRPGGTVVLADLAHVDDEYAGRLLRAGLQVDPRGWIPGTFPPQRWLVARAVRPEQP